MRDETTTSHRTVFISDLHLGSFRSDARSVLDFLDAHSAETLFLVGDVIDLWSFRRNAAWRPDHVAVIRKLIDLARSGTRVVVIPGNHDGPLVHVAEFGLPGVEIKRETVVGTARGERLLVAHGHEQDRLFGSTHGLVALFCNLGERIGEALQPVRERGGRKPLPRAGARAFSGRLKRFEAALVEVARERGFDGVVCGHSHAPADRLVDGIRYLNCGDWLGNCTAVVEDWTGETRVLRWGKSRREVARDDAPAAWAGERVPVAAAGR